MSPASAEIKSNKTATSQINLDPGTGFCANLFRGFLPVHIFLITILLFNEINLLPELLA